MLEEPKPQCETIVGPFRCILDAGHLEPCESYNVNDETVILTKEKSEGIRREGN